LVFELKKNYSWSYGGFGVDANTVGKTLERIEADTGSVTKEKLLDASRAEDSPTHNLFEWNDAIAGEKYRLEQARMAITHLRVEVVEGETEPQTFTPTIVEKVPKKVRAFTATDYSQGATKLANFMSTDTALANEEYRRTIIKNALGEFERTKDKYSFLSELAALYEAIDLEAGRYGV